MVLPYRSPCRIIASSSTYHWRFSKRWWRMASVWFSPATFFFCSHAIRPGFKMLWTPFSIMENFFLHIYRFCRYLMVSWLAPSLFHTLFLILLIILLRSKFSYNVLSLLFLPSAGWPFRKWCSTSFACGHALATRVDATSSRSPLNLAQPKFSYSWYTCCHVPC